jgi:hypothetical protein
LFKHSARHADRVIISPVAFTLEFTLGTPLRLERDI